MSGENPLLVQVGDKTVPLLWLEYWRNGVSDDESLDAFATTEDVTVDDAAAVFSELSRIFPAATVHLDIRPIPWFPYNTHFPVYFPYLEAFELPTEVQIPCSSISIAITLRLVRNARDLVGGKSSNFDTSAGLVYHYGYGARIVKILVTVQGVGRVSSKKQ